MKTMQKLFALTAMMTMLTSPVFSQNYYSEESQAYMDTTNATYMSVVIPVGLLGLAALAIATTNRTNSSYSHAGSGTLSSSSHQ